MALIMTLLSNWLMMSNIGRIALVWSPVGTLWRQSVRVILEVEDMKYRVDFEREGP